MTTTNTPTNETSVKISYEDLQKMKNWMEIDENKAKKFLKQANGDLEEALRLVVNEKL